MVKESAKRGGRLDYIVSNAAINPFMPWDETKIEDFNELFETNVRGAGLFRDTSTCKPLAHNPNCGQANKQVVLCLLIRWSSPVDLPGRIV